MIHVLATRGMQSWRRLAHTGGKGSKYLTKMNKRKTLEIERSETVLRGFEWGGIYGHCPAECILNSPADGAIQIKISLSQVQ